MNEKELTQLEQAQLDDLKAKAKLRKIGVVIIGFILAGWLLVNVAQPLLEQARINAYNDITETLGE